MVSTTDDPKRSDGVVSRDLEVERPRKRRFRVLAALVAPFRDVDERAEHKKRGTTPGRNNSKGNLFTPHAATPAKVPIRRFPRGDG